MSDLPPGAEAITLTSHDRRPLAGAWYSPVGNRPRVAVVVTHGAMGSWRGAVPAWLPPNLAAAGYGALAVDRRDAGLTGTPDVLVADCLRDIEGALDECQRRGADRLILVGHSLGTILSVAYLARSGDPRVAALVLMAPMDDGELTSRNAVQAGHYDANLATAYGLWAEGKADQAHPFASAMGRPIERTARSFIDWWAPHNALRAPRDIAAVRAPVLILRVSTDTVTPDRMSRAIADAGLAADVDVTYHELADPNPARSPSEGHSFAGNEDAATAALLTWLRARALTPA